MSFTHKKKGPLGQVVLFSFLALLLSFLLPKLLSQSLLYFFFPVLLVIVCDSNWMPTADILVSNVVVNLCRRGCIVLTHIRDASVRYSFTGTVLDVVRLSEGHRVFDQ